MGSQRTGFVEVPCAPNVVGHENVEEFVHVAAAVALRVAAVAVLVAVAVAFAESGPAIQHEGGALLHG